MEMDSNRDGNSSCIVDGQRKTQNCFEWNQTHYALFQTTDEQHRVQCLVKRHKLQKRTSLLLALENDVLQFISLLLKTS